MDAVAVLTDAYSRSRDAIAPIAGLSAEELHAGPPPSIAWQAWRMGRSLDMNVSGLMAVDQLWVADGWHERFGMAPDPRDFQPGFPPPNDVVRDFRAPSAVLLLDYFIAAYDRTQRYLATLTAEDLDHVLDEPQYDPRPTVSVRLVSVAFALAQASGPIRYRMWMEAGQR